MNTARQEGSAMQRLHEDIMQRRARATEATILVAALASRTSQQVGETLTPWLHDAFGLDLVEVLKEGLGQDVRIFTDPQGHRLLLVTLDGSVGPNWVHVEAVSALSWEQHVESAVLASYLASDEDLEKEAEDKGVKLWSSSQLEAIYCNIEHETSGISIF